MSAIRHFYIVAEVGKDYGEQRGVPPVNAPVQLRWTVGRGLSVPFAREVRLVVTEGALWLREPNEPPRLIAPAASLTQAYLRTPAQVRCMRRWPADPSVDVRVLPDTGIARRLARLRDAFEVFGPTGALILADGSGPVVAVYLPDFVPPGCRISEGLDASGASVVMAALGLSVQPPPPYDRRHRIAEGRVLLRPWRKLLARARVVHFLSLTSAAVSIWALESNADFPGPAYVTAAALVVAGTIGLVLGERRFLRGTRRGLDPAGRSVYNVPGAVAGLQVQLGRDDLVVVNPWEAEETWLGGPASGGVVSVMVGFAETHFKNEAGLSLLSFVSADLIPTTADVQRLRACCDETGVDFDEGGVEEDIGVGSTLLVHPAAVERAGLWLDPRDAGQGGISVPISCGAAAAMGLINPIAPGVVLDPVAWLLLAIHVVCWIAVGWGTWSMRRWRTSLQRGVAERRSDGRRSAGE